MQHNSLLKLKRAIELLRESVPYLHHNRLEKDIKDFLAEISLLPPTPKRGESMPDTREYWEKRALMDQELILKQKEELTKKGVQIHKLKQKLESCQRKNSQS